jgi:hypothetical protein
MNAVRFTYMRTQLKPTDCCRLLTTALASFWVVAAALLDKERAQAPTGYFLSLVNAFTNSRDVKGSAGIFSERVS